MNFPFPRAWNGASPPTPKTLATTASCACFAGLMLTGCGASAGPRSSSAAAPAHSSARAVAPAKAVAAPVAAHPLQSDKLRDAMKGFDAEVRRHVPAETDVHDRWEGIFPKIADAAAELKASALDLAGHPPKGLELPARGRFQVLGQSLVDAVGDLEDAAARSDADAVATARVRVGDACRDCHSRFRPNSPGLPDAFR